MQAGEVCVHLEVKCEVTRWFDDHSFVVRFLKIANDRLDGGGVTLP